MDGEGWVVRGEEYGWGGVGGEGGGVWMGRGGW